MDLNDNNIPDYTSRTPFLPMNVDADLTVKITHFEHRPHRPPLHGTRAYYTEFEIEKSTNPGLIPVGAKFSYIFDFTGNEWGQVYSTARLKAFCLHAVPAAAPDANRARDTLLACSAQPGGAAQYGLRVRIVRSGRTKKGPDKKPLVNPDGTTQKSTVTDFLAP